MSVGYIVTYDGNQSATAVPELIVRTADRDMLGEIRDEYIDVPGAAGSVLFAEAEGDRELGMDCIIVAADGAARRAAVRALARWVRKTSRRRLIIDNEPDRYWEAKLANPDVVTERATRGEFTLEWRTGPYALALSTTEQTSASAASGVPISVDVSGSDVEVEPVIELTATSSSGTGFTVTIGGTVLNYGSAVAPGKELTISCVTQTVVDGHYADQEFATGSFDGASLDMADVSGAFGVLGGDGGSDIVVTGIDATVRVVFRERYL